MSDSDSRRLEMPQEILKKEFSSECPVCMSVVSVAEDMDLSGILSCPECLSALVVENQSNHTSILEEAPAVGED